PRVDEVRGRRACRDRPVLDAGSQRAATQVDGQRDDLDPELFPEPGDGDRGIESARIREDDLVHGMLDPPERAWMAWKRTSQCSRRESSAKRTRSVLSPASVPSCSRRLDSSMAWAMTLAVPGVPVSTSVRALPAMRIGVAARVRA